MEKEQMLQRIQSPANEDKNILLEKLAFCRFANDYDFENYFRIEELSESELLCLISLLYYQDCFLLMQDIMSRYKERFNLQDESILEGLDFSEQFNERLARMDAI